MLSKRRSDDNPSLATTEPMNVEEESFIPCKKKLTDASLGFAQCVDIRVPGEAEVGVVEKVELTNFMCHTRLEVCFGSNVNFVIGRNGSGKSAILTGLIVGLGGNACTTSRSDTLKDFIKEGCTFATICIHLRNRGPDAFKPAEYGDTIIVERRLTGDGGGSYKIKSSENRVISTLKGELVEILDQFNILIGNPVSILTQDTARSFFSTSSEKEKYTFFLKATQLEQMSSDYQEACEQQDLMNAMLQRKKEIIPELYEMMKMTEEKKKDMEQLKLMGSQINELKKKLAWALVREKKLEVVQSTELMEQSMIKIPEYEKHMNDTTTNEKKLAKVYSEKVETMNAYNEEVQLLFAEKVQLHAKYKEKRKNMMNCCELVKRAQHDIQCQEKDRQCLVDKISKIKLAALKDKEKEHQERALQLEEHNQMKQLHESQLFAASLELRQMDTAMKRTQEQKYQMTNDLSQVQRQVRAMQQKIAALQDTKKDSLCQFGKATDSIMKAIEQADMSGKFHQKPVGPLGAFIVLKNHRWAKAVEETIKGMMCAFACTDSHDMMVLREIFKQKCTGSTHSPTIVINRFIDRLYETSKSRPSGCSPMTTVLDVLDIKNHIAANALIDQVGIESVLLVESPEEAQKLMWNIQPRGCTMAVSVEGHQIIGGRSSKYYPCKDRGGVRYFQKDTTVPLHNAEENLVVEQKKEKEMKEQLQQIVFELRRQRVEYTKAQQKCSQEQDWINRMAIEIRDLQSFEEGKLLDIWDIDVLQCEVDEIEDRLKHFSVNLDELTIELDEKREDTEGFSVATKECDERCQAAGDKLEALQDELGCYEAQLTELRELNLRYTHKLTELQKIVAQAQAGNMKVCTEYEKLRSDALSYCEEQETRRSVDSLRSEISKAQRCRNEEKNNQGFNDDEIIKKYECACLNYKKAKEEVENCLKLREAIEKAIWHRSERFLKFQESIEIRTKNNFRMLLSQRGYTGNLVFNHKQQTLIVNVDVENAHGTSTNGTSTLSGGERSFATVCFIMALWEAVEAPFRILDEFDVFMDMVNRRVSLKMLMEIAKEHTHRQFILLTPQDISSIRGTENVKIFKLTDPER